MIVRSLANNCEGIAAGRTGINRLFKTLTVLKPDTYKSWLCLAQSCGALEQYHEAADAYREVIRLKPDLPDAFSNLATMLSKLGRIEEVNAALVSVLERAATVTKRNGREFEGKARC